MTEPSVIRSFNLPSRAPRPCPDLHRLAELYSAAGAAALDDACAGEPDDRPRPAPPAQGPARGSNSNAAAKSDNAGARNLAGFEGLDI